LITSKWNLRARSGFLALALLLAAGPAAQPAMAADSGAPRALMQAPAKNCAVVAQFPGFKDVTTNSYIRKITLNEGLVIRGSRIENGKIIIPPSGLYYTTRTPKSGVLQGDKVVILGKLYHFVDQTTKLDVIKDVWVDKGKGASFGDGTKRLMLTKLQMGANGFPVPNATFQILKQSGNYYGVSFPVATSGLFTDITSGKLNKGTGRSTGTYLPLDKGQDFETEYYASSVAVSGQTYLVADKLTPKGGRIKEFGTGALIDLYLTEKDPKEALMAKGDKFSAGGFTLEVTEVGSNFADVKLTCDKSGKSWTKKLGPVTAEVLKYMPVDEEERANFMLRDSGDRAQVQLNLYKAGGPFKDGKVQVAMYYDLIKLGNPDAWAPDKRFIFRPDT
jgi:hypothetical protein